MRIVLGPAARHGARPDHADRPRPPDHPQPHHRAGRHRGGRSRSPRSTPTSCPRRSSPRVAAGGFFFLAAVLYPRGMGMGDVKLAGVLGLYLGRAVAPAILIALIAGVRRRRRDHRAQGSQGGAQDGRAVRPVPRARRPRRLLRRRRARRRVPRHLLRGRRRGRSGPWTHVGHSSPARLRSGPPLPMRRERVPAPQPPSASSSPNGQAHQDPRRARHRRDRHRCRVGRRSTAASASSAPPSRRSSPGSSATARSPTSRAWPRRCATLYRENKGLDKRVRVGVANQKIVVRVIELPYLEDAKELAAAVRFQAQDQLPMPLEHAVLDYQPLDVVNDADRAPPARAARRGAPRHGRARPRRAARRRA